MNDTKENKGPLRNFTFLESADRRLNELKKESGKTMTAVIEDLLLGRRQFRPEVENFISEQMTKFKRPRNEIIETALYVAMKFSREQMPNQQDFNDGDIVRKAVAGSSAAIRLAQESEKKQKAESPSENKPLRAASGHKRQR